ncbi:flocculation-associated PEP-CTERM protein PepA [Propionivibrio soli]|uniref:flocculation-associated PEP-CTERM protein PepA n=1 Tax=Propionivibrio soli TaxID=2976531 RepID=UPI0021E88C5D|nr:flocculation-associated PEP-CTERM protein PepA [Propionivibrio soli]
MEPMPLLGKVARRSLFAGLMLASSIGFSVAHAAIVSFNAGGTGLSGAVPATSAISVHGSGFAMSQFNPATPAILSFTELGAYQLTQPDGVSPIGVRDVTLTYSVSGTLNALTGALAFTSGLFSLYSDSIFNFGSASSNPGVMFGANDGTLIASFLITSGFGSASGTAHMNGAAVAGSILPGYFFSTGGEDLSQSGDLSFAVDIDNMIDFSPSPTVVSEIVCKAAGFIGPGCDGTPYANSPYYFVVTDGGKATLSTTVPEPGTLMLGVLGMAAIGVVRRRKVFGG